MNNQIKKKAFTMIELMIVVAIISILSILLIPKAKSQYEQSKMIGVVKNKDLLETIVRGEYEKPTYEVETEDSSIDRVYKNLENNQDLEEMTNPFSKSGRGIGFIKGNTIEDTHKAGYILTEEPEIETLPKGTVYIVIKDNEVTSGIINPDELVSNNPGTGPENNPQKPIIELISNSQLSNSTIMTKDKDIYVIGSNSYGILGTGDTKSRLNPTLLTLTATVKPKSIAIGSSHALSIGDDGNLYSWGNNFYGQLGTGDTIDRLTPTLITLPNNVKPKSIVVGVYQSTVVGYDGNLYSCGYNDANDLGIGDSKYISTFTLVVLPKGIKLKSISLGNFHTILLSESGEIYSYGLNSFGQLGVGSTIVIKTKNLVKLPNNVKAVSVSTGYNHSIAIGADGNLYGWGSNSCGQLGLGDKTNRLIPTLITLPNGVKAKSVHIGGDNTLIVGEDDNIYVCGLNTYGQLGTGDISNRITPTILNLPDGVKPKSIIMGYGHTILLGENREMYSWGFNYYGQLGTGDTTNRLTPNLVKPFDLIE